MEKTVLEGTALQKVIANPPDHCGEIARLFDGSFDRYEGWNSPAGLFCDLVSRLAHRGEIAPILVADYEETLIKLGFEELGWLRNALKAFVTSDTRGNSDEVINYIGQLVTASQELISQRSQQTP